MPITLREIRFKKRISQWELSRLTGVHQSRISLIENGHRPKEDEKTRLANELRRDPRDIEWPS
jgi:transcriptional regulator with XRE-family HTH domain